jgi:hypothetical protein
LNLRIADRVCSSRIAARKAGFRRGRAICRRRRFGVSAEGDSKTPIYSRQLLSPYYNVIDLTVPEKNAERSEGVRVWLRSFIGIVEMEDMCRSNL